MMCASKSPLLELLFVIALVLPACGTTLNDDDSVDTTPTPTPTPAPEWEADNDLIGSWRSEGEDVAPILAEPPANFKLIDTVFSADMTFEVTATDANDVTFVYSGIYQTSASGVDGIRRIRADQAEPYPATSEGIYSIDFADTPNVMYYEVVQIEPAIGATPPTPADGFGSSNSGALGDDNIQVFVRME